MSDTSKLHVLKKPRRRRRRRRRRWRRIEIPARVMYYGSLLPLVGTSILAYLEPAYIVGTAAACGWVVLVLVLHERGGFTRSRRHRRTDDLRVTFTKTEHVSLFAVLMVSVFFNLLVYIEQLVARS